MSNNETSLLVLGRQPALGLAELERLHGADKLQIISPEAVLLAIDPDQVDFGRLGGSVKLCRVLETFDTVGWPNIQDQLEQTLPQRLAKLPSGKLRLGISLYGFASISPRQVFAFGLRIKQTLRKADRSVRLIPNQAAALNSAQVLHNQLTGPTGCELVLVRSGNSTVCAQTIAEQDIESYTLRDRGRPKRNARVGMLPPKLAQIIINLAVADRLVGETVVLDPFCGTGVILQEAAVMGCGAYGTDLDQRMIDFTRQNLDWLKTSGFAPDLVMPALEVGDATTHVWDNPFDVVASETYLGQAFNIVPAPDKLTANLRTCDVIIEKFLRNISRQIEPGAPLCLAIPAWQHKSGQFLHLPLLDHLEKIGYNRVSFKHVRHEELMYFRDDQIVARELLVIVRK